MKVILTEDQFKRIIVEKEAEEHKITSDGVHEIIPQKKPLPPKTFWIDNDMSGALDNWNFRSEKEKKIKYNPLYFSYEKEDNTGTPPCFEGKPLDKLTKDNILKKFEGSQALASYKKRMEEALKKEQKNIKDYYTMDKLINFLEKNNIEDADGNKVRKLQEQIVNTINRMEIKYIYPHDNNGTMGSVIPTEVAAGKSNFFTLYPLYYHYIGTDAGSPPTGCHSNYTIKTHTPGTSSIAGVIYHELNHVVFEIIKKFIKILHHSNLAKTEDGEVTWKLGTKAPSQPNLRIKNQATKDFEYTIDPSEQFSRLSAVRSKLGITSLTPPKEFEKILYSVLRGPQSNKSPVFKKSSKYPGLYYFETPTKKLKIKDYAGYQYQMWKPSSFDETFADVFYKYINPLFKTSDMRANLQPLLSNFVDYIKSKKESTLQILRYYVDLKSLARFNNEIVKEPTTNKDGPITNVS